MKIAIIHEMLIKLWGAEKVLSELIHMYPEADVYTLMYDEKKVGNVFPKNKIRCETAAQKLFSVTGKPRFSLPLMPTSVKGISLNGYDLVISSSSGFVHGVYVSGITKHICYCHSPARYLWDHSEEVQKEIGVKLIEWKEHTLLEKIKWTIGWPLVSGLFDQLRKWDTEAAKRPNIYVANSAEVCHRIDEYYHRQSVVLWPPVDTTRFTVGPLAVSRRDYYVITSALTPFKLVDRAVRVMTKLGINLKVIGDGAQKPELQKIAGKTIEFLGRISDEELAVIYARARGFLMPQKEDAGIAPLEAMASGIPVFGLAKGGLLEVNVDGVTGRFFSEETDESFEKWFLIFHREIGEWKYDNSEPLLVQAKKFDAEHFRRGFQEIVKSQL